MKKLKFTLNKIFLIFTISLIVFSLMPKEVNASSVYQSGMSEAELRQAFVSEILKFINSNSSKCFYPETGVYRMRERTYKNGIYSDGNYWFDCVGWVSYAFHHLGLNLGNSDWQYFAYPNDPYIGEAHFVLTNIGNEQIGDILIYPQTNTHLGHVAIYLGEINGQKSIADMTRTSGYTNGGLAVRSITPVSGGLYEHYTGDTFTIVVHLNSFEDINFSPVEDFSSNFGPGILADFKPQGDIGASVDLDSLGEFEFSGNPSVMNYEGEKDLVQWLFSNFSQFIDYILGIIAQALKGTLVGWTSIVEDCINSALIFLSLGK